MNADEDTSKAITLSGTDVESCGLSFSIVSGPSHGSLSAISDNDCAAATPNTDSAGVTYTPASNYNGTDSFSYKVHDTGDGSSAALDSGTATVSITVTPVNDAPAASNDSATVAEGGTVTVLDSTAASVLANDTDAEGNTLTATKLSDPAHGSVTLNADGTFSYS
ncbi:MAG: hypothetical protein E6I38_10930, partial [Chloroflexi bacterium]